jgi:hypothetical protein
MAGLDKTTPTPQDITVHGQSRVLEVSFSDGQTFRIPFELMRVYSPSAEVQGHGPGQETLQTGKRDVGIVGLEWHLLLGLPVLSGIEARRAVGRLQRAAAQSGGGS